MKRSKKRPRFNNLHDRSSDSSEDNYPLVYFAKVKRQHIQDESDDTSHSSGQPEAPEDNLSYEIIYGEREVNHVKPENSSDTDNSEESSPRPAGSISCNPYDGSDEYSDSSENLSQNTDITDGDAEHTPFKENSLNYSPIILSPDVSTAPDPYNGSIEDSDDTKQMEGTDTSQQYASIDSPDISRSPSPDTESGDNPYSIQNGTPNSDLSDEHQATGQMEGSEYAHDNRDTDSSFSSPVPIPSHGYYNADHDGDLIQHPPRTPDVHYDISGTEDQYTGADQVPIVSSTVSITYYDPIDDFEVFQDPPPTPDVHNEASDIHDLNNSGYQR